MPFLVVFTFVPMCIAAEQEEEIALAQILSERWINIVDEGQYSESWDLFASLFQERVSRPDWIDELTELRASVGGLKSRTIIGVRYALDLPQAPPGEYVVVQYDSEFELHGAVLETILSLKTPNNGWRIAGYYLEGNLAQVPNNN